jgi:hypothetical protein
MTVGFIAHPDSQTTMLDSYKFVFPLLIAAVNSAAALSVWKLI